MKSEKLTQEQLAFLKEELNLSVSDISSLAEEALEDMYDRLCAIEEVEAVEHGDNPTDRLRMVADLVDIFFEELEERT